jgi:hypothetical protein
MPSAQLPSAANVSGKTASPASSADVDMKTIPPTAPPAAATATTHTSDAVWRQHWIRKERETKLPTTTVGTNASAVVQLLDALHVDLNAIHSGCAPILERAQVSVDPNVVVPPPHDERDDDEHEIEVTPLGGSRNDNTSAPPNEDDFM